MASRTTATQSTVSQADLDAFEKRRAMTLTLEEWVQFLTQLATSVEAGTGISDFLREREKLVELTTVAQIDRKAFLLSGAPSQSTIPFIKELTRMVCDLGFDFSKAGQQFPAIFDQHLLAVLKAAEKSGDYAPVLRRYCDNLRQRKATRDAIVGALIYPGFVIGAALVVIALFMVVVGPAFKTIYEGLLPKGEELPWITQMVLSTSDFVVGHWVLLGSALALMVGGYVTARRSGPTIRQYEHKIVLEIPVLSSYVAQLEVVNFLSTFIMLFQAGAILTDCAELGVDSITNIELRTAAMDGVDVFRAGHVSTLAKALATAHPVFSTASSFYVEMTNFEKTGSVESLQRYLELLQHNANQTRERLLKLMEPLTIILLGGLIGVLVAAMYMPLFHLIGRLAGSMGGR